MTQNTNIDRLCVEISRLGFTTNEKVSMFSHLIKQQPNIISNTLTILSHLEDDGKIDFLKNLPIPGMLVHIFIDNSNFFLMGSQVVAKELEKLNLKPNLLDFYVDYNKLVTTILKGRPLGRIFIVGSAPPDINKLWNWLRDYHGYDVEIIEQKVYSREKQVDTTLVCEAMDTILSSKYSSYSNTLALVAGDGDYTPLLKKARGYNWQTETHFWSQGLSNFLIEKEVSSYFSLDSHYKSFFYVIGFNHTRCKYAFKITGIIKSWEWNENLMESFGISKSLGWWYWENNGKSALLYFDNKKQLEDAKVFLLSKYPDIRVEELQRNNNLTQGLANLPQQQITNVPLIDQLFHGDFIYKNK